MKASVSLAGMALLIAMSMSAHAAVITIDDGAGTGVGTGFSVSAGDWTSYSARAVGGAYLAPNAGNGTATYTPGNVSGFVSGTYDVYASWGVFNADDGVSYVVNHAGGTASFNFDNKLNAAQGATGSIPQVDESGSGFRYLGTYNLNTSSNVVLSINAGQADAVMFRSRDDGFFIDHQAANLTTNDSTAWSIAGTTTSPSGNYFYTVTDAVTATWAGIPTAGSYDLKISWGVHTSHSQNVKYLVDVNGNGINDSGDTLFTIDQHLMADQVTGGSPDYGLWSGYYDLGTFSLTGSSKVVQWDEGGAGAMTVAPLLITPIPEPSTIILLVTAVFGLVVYAWRKMK